LRFHDRAADEPPPSDQILAEHLGQNLLDIIGSNFVDKTIDAFLKRLPSDSLPLLTLLVEGVLNLLQLEARDVNSSHASGGSIARRSSHCRSYLLRHRNFGKQRNQDVGKASF
jgi:hypothetical protein